MYMYDSGSITTVNPQDRQIQQNSEMYRVLPYIQDGTMSPAHKHHQQEQVRKVLRKHAESFNRLRFTTKTTTTQTSRLLNLLPAELLLEIFSHLDSYTVIKSREVCRTFYFTAEATCPGGLLLGKLPIHLWEYIFAIEPDDPYGSNPMDLHLIRISKTCRSLRNLIKYTKDPYLRKAMYFEPLSEDPELTSRPPVLTPRLVLTEFYLRATVPSKGLLYNMEPRFANNRRNVLDIEKKVVGDPIYLRANASSPPVKRAMLKWNNDSTCRIYPTFIESGVPGRAISVGDVWYAAEKMLSRKLDDVQAGQHEYDIQRKKEGGTYQFYGTLYWPPFEQLDGQWSDNVFSRPTTLKLVVGLDGDRPPTDLIEEERAKAQLDSDNDVLTQRHAVMTGDPNRRIYLAFRTIRSGTAIFCLETY